jgi:DNA invertase Pin-like site-specific DNA recombinase
MSSAVRILRSSQGDENKVSLDVQDDKTVELAEDLDTTIERTIDLGIHTAFSAFVRGTDTDNRIDANPEIQELLEELRTGEYDYLIAYDDSRVARDDFFFILHYACIMGDVEMVFVEDIELDSLEFRVKRVVEQHVKQTEIRKSQEARERRRENGGREGEPPTGLDWDDDHHGWEPDEDFEDVLRVLALKDEGFTHREVVKAVDVVGSTGTVSNILNRRDEYETQMLEHGYTYPDLEQSLLN